MAMLLVEAIEAQNKHCNVQVFATDLDKDALEHARNGMYPENITEHVL